MKTTTLELLKFLTSLTSSDCLRNFFHTSEKPNQQYLLHLMAITLIGLLSKQELIIINLNLKKKLAFLIMIRGNFQVDFHLILTVFIGSREMHFCHKALKVLKW